MRAIWLVPLLIGAFLGFTVPVDSAPLLVLYTVQMLPASGSAGQFPVLTCGYHDMGCSPTVGNYLDWDNTTTLNVYFRGFFTRASSPYETNRLRGDRPTGTGGPSVCEVQDVKIVAVSSGTLLGVMRYLHTSQNSTASFPIATSGSGVYNAKWIGAIVTDSGANCPWNGTHVHAGYTTSGSASRSKHTSLYPNGSYCDPPSGNCDDHQNNIVGNWTHKFTWSGS